MSRNTKYVTPLFFFFVYVTVRSFISFILSSCSGVEAPVDSKALEVAQLRGDRDKGQMKSLSEESNWRRVAGRAEHIKEGRGGHPQYLVQQGYKRRFLVAYGSHGDAGLIHFVKLVEITRIRLVAA